MEKLSMWNTLKQIGEVLGILTVPRLQERHVVRLSEALNTAMAQLAQAEIELADKAFYVREFASVSQERDELKAELADLRERESVPVKVRCVDGPTAVWLEGDA